MIRFQNIRYTFEHYRICDCCKVCIDLTQQHALETVFNSLTIELNLMKPTSLFPLYILVNRFSGESRARDDYYYYRDPAVAVKSRW
jgi:hypothetical protein